MNSSIVPGVPIHKYTTPISSSRLLKKPTLGVGELQAPRKKYPLQSRAPVVVSMFIALNVIILTDLEQSHLIAGAKTKGCRPARLVE